LIGRGLPRLAAVDNDDLSSDCSAPSSTHDGWCLDAGKGVPVDFTIAAEFFKKACDSNDADGLNSFCYYVERGEDIDENIEHAVFYYRKAGSRSYAYERYNFAHCLEYDKVIGQNFIRAAKYRHLSAELNDANAQNNFGICLERSIGAQPNLTLEAHYYQ
jgi:TPR repeat protein